MQKILSRHGPAEAESPVLISVPHAGRRYPAAMSDLARLGPEHLSALEDRHADRLVTAAIDAGHSVITAEIARAWIDLNRGEDEIDPGMMEPHHRPRHPVRMSAKVRGGLGLIPRRIAEGGEIWKAALSEADVSDRIAAVHRPYHEDISNALEERLDKFGCAILLDLHTMPPVRTLRGEGAPHLVIGDLYGRSAFPRFTASVVAEGQAAGFRTAHNAPYAGGHILSTHARPRCGVHALQLEIDRSLYLDVAMEEPGPGVAAISQLVRRIADALAKEAFDMALPLAAE